MQVLVRAERLDLSGQIAELREQAGGLPHPALEQAAREHADYLDQLGRATDLLRRQVLLVLREPLHSTGPTDGLGGASPLAALTARRKAAKQSGPVDDATRRAAEARLVRRLGEAVDLLSPSGIIGHAPGRRAGHRGARRSLQPRLADPAERRAGRRRRGHHDRPGRGLGRRRVRPLRVQPPTDESPRLRTPGTTASTTPPRTPTTTTGRRPLMTTTTKRRARNRPPVASRQLRGGPVRSLRTPSPSRPARVGSRRRMGRHLRHHRLSPRGAPRLAAAAADLPRPGRRVACTSSRSTPSPRPTGCKKQLSKLESGRRHTSEKGRLIDPQVEAATEDAYDLSARVARGEGKLYRLGPLPDRARRRPRKPSATRSPRSGRWRQSLLLDCKPTTYRSLQGWITSLPMGLDLVGMRRTFDTAALSAAFPFTSPDLPPPDPTSVGAPSGVLYGFNVGSPGSGAPRPVRAWTTTTR